MLVATHSVQQRARLPLPLTSLQSPRFKFSRANTQSHLTLFAATHAQSSRVNPFAATHTKWLSVSPSPATHTKKQGCPRHDDALISGIVQCEVSRRRTASDSTCPRSIASLVPSGENRNPAICSEAKCVTCRRGEPSSGCPHRLSMFFSRTTYNTDLASGANAKGGEALGSKS